MKIISGGQSGADLAGNLFAKKHGIETEINAEKNYKPLYDDIPKDIKINVVSDKEGNKGGWIERRRYNIRNSDFTLILLERPIEFTRGSKGTYNDCIKLKKDVLYIDVLLHKGECWCTKDILLGGRDYLGFNVNNLNEARKRIRSKKIEVLNIAGERKLTKLSGIVFLEKLLLNEGD